MPRNTEPVIDNDNPEWTEEDFARGTTLDIVEAGGTVTLRQTKSGVKGGFAKALKKLRVTVDYDGSVYKDADWKAAIDAKFRKSDAV